MKTTWLKSIAVFAVVGFGAAACGDSAVEPEAQPSVEPLVEAAVVDQDSGASLYGLDLFYAQDSHGFGVADRYAELVERELGIDVVVHDNAIGNLSAAEILARIRGEEGRSDWSDLIQAAEIIVIYGNPLGSGYTSDIVTCVSGSTSEREPPVRYSEADWQPYQDVLEQIYEEIWAIREGDPVVLLAPTALNPAISAWRAAGIEAECTVALEAWNASIARAAETGGATVVPVYEAFNGPAHDEDPREEGWIGPDGLHLSDAGKAAVAETLAAAGFEPVTPPPG